VRFIAAVSAASSPPSGDVQAGVLGFLVVAAIGVALVFLLRSMNKQFKKIGPKPEEPLEPSEAEDAPEEHTVSGPVVAGRVVADEVVTREPGTAEAESGAEPAAGRLPPRP
jgi:hypothetical protein